MSAQPKALAPIVACGNCKRAIPDGCDGKQYAFKWPGSRDNRRGVACRGQWGSDLDQVTRKLRVTQGHGIVYEVDVEPLVVPPA